MGGDGGGALNGGAGGAGEAWPVRDEAGRGRDAGRADQLKRAKTSHRGDFARDRIEVVVAGLKAHQTRQGF